MARRKLYLWQLILAGPFLIWMGIHEYGELADLESHGGTLYVGRLTHFLYTIGGKNLVLVVTCGFGVFYLWALVRWIKHEKIRRSIDEPGEVAAPTPKPEKRAPREAPPRITDDPFRAPPAPRPIVATPTQRPIETPVVASAAGPDEGPKLLR